MLAQAFESTKQNMQGHFLEECWSGAVMMVIIILQWDTVFLERIKIIIELRRIGSLKEGNYFFQEYPQEGFLYSNKSVSRSFSTKICGCKLYQFGRMTGWIRQRGQKHYFQTVVVSLS